MNHSPPPSHAATTHAPPPAPMQSSGGGSMLGGIASTIAEGMAFGTGSAIAHRAVDAVMGPRVVQHEHTSVPSPAAVPMASPVSSVGGGSCAQQAKAFEDCITGNASDVSKCQFYVDMLNECKKNTSMGV